MGLRPAKADENHIFDPAVFRRALHAVTTAGK